MLFLILVAPFCVFLSLICAVTAVNLTQRDLAYAHQARAASDRARQEPPKIGILRHQAHECLFTASEIAVAMQRYNVAPNIVYDAVGAVNEHRIQVRENIDEDKIDAEAAVALTERHARFAMEAAQQGDSERVKSEKRSAYVALNEARHSTIHAKAFKRVAETFRNTMATDFFNYTGVRWEDVEAQAQGEPTAPVSGNQTVQAQSSRATQVPIERAA